MATINFRLVRNEVRDALARVRPSTIFAAEEFAPMVFELASEVQNQPLLVCLGSQNYCGVVDWDQLGPKAEISVTGITFELEGTATGRLHRGQPERADHEGIFDQGRVLTRKRGSSIKVRLEQSRYVGHAQ